MTVAVCIDVFREGRNMKYLFYIIGSVLGAIVGTLISHGDLYAFKYYLLVCMIAGLFVELSNER